MVLAGLLSFKSATAQQPAPGLAWRTDIGATLFAVDAQTNLYANSGGTVITLNGSGAPLSTNPICPLAGRAQRDTAGNFLFAGTFSGTQDFGGITIVGGLLGLSMNPAQPFELYGSSCFLARYGPSGKLLTAVQFGGQGVGGLGVPVAPVTDIGVDPAGGCYVGYMPSNPMPPLPSSGLAHIAPNGAYDWGVLWPLSPAVRVGAATSSNCCAIFGTWEEVSCALLASPGVTVAEAAPFPPAGWPLVQPFMQNAKPVLGLSNDVYVTVLASDSDPAQYVLRKCLMDTGYGSVAWELDLATAQSLLGSDHQGSLFLADNQGGLAKYTEDGALVWSTNYGTEVTAVVVDAQNNRFVNLSDGSVGRLLADPPFSPYAATATAEVANGFVVGVTNLDGGYGYTNTPTVQIIGGGGSGAEATAVVANGVVTAINILGAGAGYTNSPLVIVAPPFILPPAMAIGPARQLSFANLAPGANYQLQAFNGQSWTNFGASFAAPGANFTQYVPGTATASGYRLTTTPVPAQAYATAQTTNGFVIGAAVTSGGSGYAPSPAVSIVSNGSGSGATAAATVNNGVVIAINIISAGSGYATAPTVLIAPPPVATSLSPLVAPAMELDLGVLAPYQTYQLEFSPAVTGPWTNFGNPFVPAQATNAQFGIASGSAGFFRVKYAP